MSETDDITVTDGIVVSDSDHSTVTDRTTGAERDGPPSTDSEAVLARLQEIESPTTGIITGIRQVPVPADEPYIESYVVQREDFAPLTDGEAMSHNEGGCGFSRTGALIATYGEAIERYCGCVYDQAGFQTASYSELSEPALDPTAVVNFSPQQRASMAERGNLCGVDDELSWISGRNLNTGADTYLPAQLVYLSYPTTAEPFIRNPITTGLAAGSSWEMAITNGLCELIERDAFMIYYLTKTELPVIDLDTASPRIQRLADRVTAHGLELTLLDATSDLGVPVVIGLLIDRESRPAVTVAAAADPDASAAIESALEEVVQTRLWGVSNLDTTRAPDDLSLDEISSYQERGLLWSVPERLSDLDFWIESTRETTVEEFAAGDLTGQDLVAQLTAAGYDCYGADITTRDIASLGFTVQRVIVPRLQPLYLLERLRYFGGERLFETPVEMGYRETPLTETELNTVPHPFP